MAEKESDKVMCPACSSHNVCLLSQKSNLRPRSQTGNLQTDLTPISTTLTYKCQNQDCGHEWNETTDL
jgi:hypothetical protein